mgnify:FL=1
MGQGDKLDILIKALCNETDRIPIDAQIKKIEEKLKHHTTKIEITSETINLINNSYKIDLDKSKGANNILIPTKSPNVKKSSQLNKLLEKYSISDIIRFIIFGAAYLSSSYAIRKFADAIEEINKTEKDSIKALTLLSEAGFAPNKEIDKNFIEAVNESECIENVRSQRKIIAQLAFNHYGERLLKSFSIHAAVFSILITEILPTMNAILSSNHSLMMVLGISRGVGTAIPKSGLSVRTGGKATKRF